MRFLARNMYDTVSTLRAWKRADPKLEEVQEIIDKRGPGGVVVSNPIWLASFHINERKVHLKFQKRYFVAGNANKTISDIKLRKPS
jgi:hypothetical protein